MSEALKNLRSMSEAQLIEAHDKLAESTQVGINHYLCELQRRELDRQTDQILQYTRWMTLMTVAVLICTVLNLILVGVTTYRAF